MSTTFYAHPSAEVSKEAQIGQGAKIWNQAQIQAHAQVGAECVIGKNVYIDFKVTIGARCKIQNNSSVYHGVELQEGVFVGPHVVFTNDKIPRAINPDGSLKRESDWVVGKTLVCQGASIGAGAIILPGIQIGRFAMVGSGAVVTKNVPDFALVLGAPARIVGAVNEAGLVERFQSDECE